MVTIKDIAKKLQIDHSTVGYALSGKGTIKEDTRKLVIDTAREMGYVPNVNAQRIRNHKTRSIGVVFPQIVMGYNEIIQHMFALAAEKNYDLVIDITEFNTERENRGIRSMLEARVDGIIIRPCFPDLNNLPDDHSLKYALRQKLPVVSYNAAPKQSGFSKVTVPLSKTAKLATGHLLEKGHRRLALLSPVSNTDERMIKACRNNLGESGGDLKVISFSDSGAYHKNTEYHQHIMDLMSDKSIEVGKALFRQAVSMEPRPTALIFVTESTAIGGIIEAAAMGLKIPDDIAVLCLNRSLVTPMSPVPMTTVCASNEVVGRRMLNFMIDHIEGRVNTGSSLTINPVLIQGKST